MGELYKKSVLFEIVNKQNTNEIEAAFTLTIPPDSMEIVQTQRVNRTNTFGGVFEDDYGLGIAKITISGNTGNEELRATYIPGEGSPLTYNGKTAIYTIRDQIIRYKEYIADQGLENFEMRFYDLSVINPDIWDAGSPEEAIVGSLDAWIVSLDDFKISRNKDKPLWYNYTIELTAISPLGLNRKKKPADLGEPIPPSTPDPDSVGNIFSQLHQLNELVKKTKSWLKDAIGTIRRIVNTITNSFAWAQDKINDVNTALDLLKDLENQIDEYIYAAGNLISGGTGVLRRLLEIPKFPGAIAVSSMNAITTVMEGFKTTIDTEETVQASLGNDTTKIQQLANEANRVSRQIVVYGKSQKAEVEISVNIAGEDITIYGTKTITATAGTTLERIAATQYGDPSKELLLSLFNGFTTDEITSGTIIKIPIINRISETNQTNKIYSWERNSWLGTDIKMDPVSGKIVFSESGDFSRISDMKNMVQAYNLRLNESLGKRMRLTTYGIKAGVGSAKNNSASVSYLISNIVDSLKQDPRTKFIYNMKLVGVGDNLQVSFNSETISGKMSYEGRI